MSRRYDRRLKFIIPGIFVAATSFTFLSQAIKSSVGAVDLKKFDPGLIVSDFVMGNSNAMTEKEIQEFLTSKNSCKNTDQDYYNDLVEKYPGYTWHFENDHFVCISEELFGDGEIIGEGETAAHIIWQAAKDYEINPQVLLVLLEKETSLVTDPIPNNKDYRKATGYGCPDTAACSEKYYGFKNQIRSAAAMFHTVLTGGWTNYPLGENYIQYNPDPNCGGSTVEIKNLATSALYRYTPYQPNQATLDAGRGTAECGAYGNRNFYIYYSEWFGDPTIEPVVQIKKLAAKLVDNTIELSWEVPKNADKKITKYEIVLVDSKKKETKYEAAADVTKYTFSKLPKGKYTAVTVKAITKDEEVSEKITFSLEVKAVLSAPQKVSYKLNDDGNIEVSWQAPSDPGETAIKKYEVEIKNSYGIATKAVVKDVKKLSYVFENLPAGVYTSVTVTVYNEKENQKTTVKKQISTFAEFKNDETEYKKFKDMPQDEISKKAVSWAVNNGITDKNEYFNGEQALTRRQAMVLLWRISGQPESEIYKKFKDMPKDEISKKAVSWAVNNGITDKNEYFNGEQPVTRRQAMVLLWRYIKLSFGKKL